MELNKKTIKTILKALVIAKESTQIAFSSNQLHERINCQTDTDKYMETQSQLIDSIDNYEKLIGDFRELDTRQDYKLSEE